MQQSSINEIKINTGKQKPNRFNFAHDNNTSYDWGSVQPLVNKEMQPESSANIEIESLLRLAPMVVPTFGRVRVKNTAHFIKYQELWPNWDAMLAKKPVTRPTTTSDGKQSNTTFVPTKVPSIAADLLACFILTGARMSLWGKLNTNGNLKNAWIQYGVRDNVTADDKIAKRNILEKVLTKCLGMSNNGGEIEYIGYKGPIAQLTNIAKSIWTYGANPAKPRMPINTYAYDVADSENEKYGNPNIAMMNIKTYNTSEEDKNNWMYQIKMSAADVAIDIQIPASKAESLFDILSDNEFTTLKQYFTNIGLAFKLSNFGKRLRKVLITSGYPIDFNCKDEYSVLPLMAYYYAWWITYAPERTKNYYSSNQYKLIQETLNGNDNSLTDKFKNNYNPGLVVEWLYDVGNCYATEKMDVFAAATEHPNIDTDGLTYNVAGLEAMSPWYQSFITRSSDTAPNYNASGEPVLKISQGASAEISQQQLEILKKLYRITNKASAAGQNLGETLKALGLGKEVEESRGIFINSGETPIKISDVIAQSATEERPLGDWGGKGMGHGLFKVNYKTDCYGILTIISCIVPESGYVNGADNTLKDITRDSKPNPEFDGISVEAVEKKQVQGVVQTSSWGNANPGGLETFGYLPTYTKYKFMTNKANGDFSLYSKRNSMQPYTIDKILPLQVTIEDTKKQAMVDQKKQYDDNDRYVEFTNMPMSWEDMPIAGEEWRYVSKYLWNGQYDRIFEMGVNTNDYMGNEILQNNNSIILFNSTGYDNFMSHNVINFMYYMGMKAIEETYNTFDEEHAPNSSVKKQ